MSKHANYATLKTLNNQVDIKNQNTHLNTTIRDRNNQGSNQGSNQLSDYNVIEVQNIDHKNHIIVNNNVVCVYLFADWCIPCKKIAPEYAQLAKYFHNPGTSLLVKENIDLKLTKDYNCGGVPAFIFYKNGQIVRNKSGKVTDVIGGGEFQQVFDILNNLK